MFFEVVEKGESMASRAEMKKEAINRMKRHGLSSDVIAKFENNNTLYCSEDGVLRELTGNERIMIAKFEKESYCLVYHLIHCHGKMETYELCRVSFYSEDWDYENSNIDNGWLLVRSENITKPEWSESGSIIIKESNGALTRIY